MTPATRARGCAVTMPPVPLGDLSARQLGDVVMAAMRGRTTFAVRAAQRDAAGEFLEGLGLARQADRLSELGLRALGHLEYRAGRS